MPGGVEQATPLPAFPLCGTGASVIVRRAIRNGQRGSRNTIGATDGSPVSKTRCRVPQAHTSSGAVTRRLRTSGATEERAIRSVTEARSPQILEHARTADGCSSSLSMRARDGGEALMTHRSRSVARGLGVALLLAAWVVTGQAQTQGGISGL